ncbi:MAG: hypothetical protein K2J89_02210 [Clostridia bacterium]|nr:hypothetical protein [Clostridia bacterium]
MAIKFPQNIEEYTNGDLWYAGVDDSIARRILFSLNAVDDPREMRLRKTYLAHWYCEREDYRLAENLCRQLIMENGSNKDILLLMQYCCVKRGDVLGISEVFNSVKLLSEEDRDSFMENFTAEELPAETFYSLSEKKKGAKVEYKDGWVEYYQKNKLIFKYFDNDNLAFMKDNAARRLLGEGDAIGAIAQLDAIKFRHLRKSTQFLCQQTYVTAFLELGEHLNAYSHCKIFIDEKMYIEAMLPLLEGLRSDGYISQFEELRKYIATLEGYDVYQLTDFFDYSDETGDFGFWEMLEESNPLGNLKESDERLCLEGRAFERKDDFISAQKSWRKAVSIYGQFSRAKYYLSYPKVFAQAEERVKAEYGDDYLERSDYLAVMTEFCKDIVMSDLDDWSSTKDIYDDYDKKTAELSLALCDYYIDVDRLSYGVGRIYRTGWLPIVSEINRIAVSEDVDDINRAVCLANYLLHSNKKQIMWKGEKRRNIVAELSGGNEQVKYGIAMFAAHAMIRLRADAKGIEKVNDELKTLCSMINQEASVKAYILYGFLLEYYANLKLPQKRMPDYINDLDDLIEELERGMNSEEKQESAEFRNNALSKLHTIKTNI